MFTDIVGSTARATELGDARWKVLLGEHHARIRTQLSRFRGTEVDIAGDGFFAVFDGPALVVDVYGLGGVRHRRVMGHRDAQGPPQRECLVDSSTPWPTPMGTGSIGRRGTARRVPRWRDK